MTVTRQPRPRQASTMCEPMKPAPPVTRTCIEAALGHDSGGLLEDAQEVLAVAALLEPVGLPPHGVRGHQSEQIGYLLGTGDLESLAKLDLLHEIRGAEQRLLRSRVEPGKAAAERLDFELPRLQVSPVQIGDLHLSARRLAQRGDQIAGPRIVEVKTGDGEVGLRRLRLLFDGNRAAGVV